MTFNQTSFSQGVFAGAVLVAILAALGMWQTNAGWQRTIENHKKLERTLMDRIELRDQQDMALRSSVQADAQVKTFLIENGSAIRAAWTIPGRVVPHTDDGRAIAYYTYLDSTGHIEGWRRASRDEAPNVLDVTLSEPLPLVMSPEGTAAPFQPNCTGAITTQQLLEAWKALHGARP